MIGNQAAQKIIYNKYKKIVKNYIVYKYSTYNDIEDDVSEILIKVFLNIKDFDNNKSKFKSWVLTITKNYMVDKWRNKTIIYSSDFTNLLYNCSTLTSNAFDNINAINYISTQLSPYDFTLLDLKYVQGYNYSEIGDKLQITSSTVSNKINYIKTKLKKNISEEVFR